MISSFEFIILPFVFSLYSAQYFYIPVHRRLRSLPAWAPQQQFGGGEGVEGGGGAPAGGATWLSYKTFTFAAKSTWWWYKISLSLPNPHGGAKNFHFHMVRRQTNCHWRSCMLWGQKSFHFSILLWLSKIRYRRSTWTIRPHAFFTWVSKINLLRVSQMRVLGACNSHGWWLDLIFSKSKVFGRFHQHIILGGFHNYKVQGQPPCWEAQQPHQSEGSKILTLVENS